MPISKTWYSVRLDYSSSTWLIFMLSVSFLSLKQNYCITPLFFTPWSGSWMSLICWSWSTVSANRHLGWSLFQINQWSNEFMTTIPKDDSPQFCCWHLTNKWKTVGQYSYQLSIDWKSTNEFGMLFSPHIAFSSE